MYFWTAQIVYVYSTEQKKNTWVGGWSGSVEVWHTETTETLKRPLKHVSTNNRELYQKQPSLMFSRFLSEVKKPSYRESSKSNIWIS